MKKVLISLLSLLAVVAVVFTSILVFNTVKKDSFENPFSLFSEKANSFSLDVKVEGEGKVEGAEKYYKKNSLATLEAKANENSVFYGWYDGEDRYLTSSPVYSFTIDENATIVAKFGDKEDSLNWSVESVSSLSSVKDNFTFEIDCDREDAEEYLKENLKVVQSQFVGTEFEDDASKKVKIEKIDEGKFEVSLEEGEQYEKGVSYTAVIEEEKEEGKEEGKEEEDKPDKEELDASINFTGSNEGDFKVEKEETEVIEAKKGMTSFSLKTEVTKLVDDGLFEGDAGDKADYVVVTDTKGIVAGEVFLVYGGATEEEENENSFYAKAKSVEGNKIVYTLPELSEIFDNLDIHTNNEIELDGIDFDSNLVEGVKDALLNNESFIQFANLSEKTISNLIDTTGYVVEPCAKYLGDRLNISVDSYLKDKTTAKVKIVATLFVPITNGEKSTSVAVKMNIEKNITLSRYANLVISLFGGIPSYDFSVSITDEEICDVNILVDPNAPKEITAEVVRDKFTTEYNHVAKDALLLEKVDTVSATKTIDLFELSFTSGILKYSIDVDMALNLDFTGSLNLKSTTTNTVEVGVRSEGRLGIRPYTNLYGNANVSSLTAVGDSSYSNTVSLKADVRFMNVILSRYMKKLSFSIEEGRNFESEGLVNTVSGHVLGNLEVTSNYKAAASYKLFSASGNWSSSIQEHSLGKYGNEKAIVSYVNQSALTKEKATVNFIGSTFDLLSSDLLDVRVYDANSNKITKESLASDSTDYKVTVTTGKVGISYKDGKLSLDDPKATYIKDTVTIKVENKNKAWGKYNKNKVPTYLPEIKLSVVYGNEDLYYASIDSSLEKEFRLLFRSYDDESADVLHSNFSNLVNNVISIPAEYNDIFSIIAESYINNMFGEISSLKKIEDDNRTQENAFVKAESAAFEYLMNFINSVIRDKGVDAGEAEDMMAYIAKSSAMKKTIIETSRSSSGKTLSSYYKKASKETQQMIDKAVTACENTASEYGISDVARAFRRLLS